jgi:hypothetical protein
VKLLGVAGSCSWVSFSLKPVDSQSGNGDREAIGQRFLHVITANNLQYFATHQEPKSQNLTGNLLYFGFRVLRGKRKICLQEGISNFQQYNNGNDPLNAGQ